MLMSDSVAVLMPLYPNPYVTVFPPPPCDPDYFLDLKKHLQENAEYRKERKEFYKLHPGWSLFKARDEFAREYSETYHRDIEWFKAECKERGIIITKNTYNEARAAMLEALGLSKGTSN